MDTYDKDQNTKVSFLFPKGLTERMDEVAVNIGVSRSQLLRKSTKEYLHFLENQYQRNNTNETIPTKQYSTCMNLFGIISQIE